MKVCLVEWSECKFVLSLDHPLEHGVSRLSKKWRRGESQWYNYSLPIFIIQRSYFNYFLQDHVYCSPNWDTRDGTPYSVARIMQFLPPEDAPKGEEGKNYLYTRVRLAWYYRPSDVSDRPLADSRLLLAAIYSEVCDINQLRAKCHVVHRDKITDFAGWKKRPDRFYFNRLFDPYIKKEFEVIQSHDVRNRRSFAINKISHFFKKIV